MRILSAASISFYLTLVDLIENVVGQQQRRLEAMQPTTRVPRLR
jgi:hypothetical protein